MKFTIPIYVEEHPRGKGAAPQYTVRPLFHAEPVHTDELVGRATSRVAGVLRRHLDALGRLPRHDALADWTFSPPLTEHHPRLMLMLRRSTFSCSPTVVTLESLGRTIAMVPAAGELWFELMPGQQLKQRAAEVLEAYLARREKEAGVEIDPPAGLNHKAWLSSIELDVATSQRKKAPPPKFLMLGGPEIESGADELERVGRCLDRLYPDDLERAILREDQVNELSRLLSDTNRRPIVLLGARMVGKTAIIHEHVFRKVQHRKNPFSRNENLWLIAPQRLISGMMYVGQWEARLLAILDEARKRDHVLYFDDLLGLYQAGISGGSDLSVAHVLRPYIERQEVRVLAEMTHQAMRILRERDRALADLLHIVPVEELPPAQSQRILIESMRQLEGRHRCRFELDALPTACDLLERYVRDTVMPGKAAMFMRRLALKHRSSEIGRQTVLDEFHTTSGLSIRFLDNRQRLLRKEVVDALSAELIGQDAAVQAMADVVGVAKARLNETTRPLASLLFLGPTGVGKTHAAKSLARYLFGDADRLVRFDMNECVDYAAAARLVGSGPNSEGLLTSAIRRQPFSVILLDEIEKAHPDVFDLLLQVLGEARLTDSLGRTADFSNSIVVFTSNLGVREASSSFGLRSDNKLDPTADEAADRQRDAAFVGAAERFFRPELFNRLDRLIPFRPLARAEVQRIATRLIRDLFSRDGLMQRKCVLQVDPAAMQRIVDQGFHPQLGARALKRAVEHQLTQPIATRLAEMTPGLPTVIDVLPEAEGICVRTIELQSVAPLPRMIELGNEDPLILLDRLSAALDRIEADAEATRPEDGLTQGRLGPRHYRYLVVREQAQRVRRMVERAYDREEASRRRNTRFTPGRASPRSVKPVSLRRVGKAYDSDDHALWRALAAAEQVNSFMAELDETSEPVGEGSDEASQLLVREAALLQAMATADPDGRDDRVLVHIRALAATRTSQQAALRSIYERLFDITHGFTARQVKHESRDAGEPPEDTSELLLAEMPGVLPLMRAEAGTHLFLLPDGNLLPILVMVLPLASTDDPLAASAAHAARRAAWLKRPSDGPDPWTPGPVIRVYGHSASGTLDLRSRLMTQTLVPTPAEVRAFMLAQLPLPVELTESN